MSELSNKNRMLNKFSKKIYNEDYTDLEPEQKKHILSMINVEKHLNEDIKESKKSIKEDKELKKTLGKMM